MKVWSSLVVHELQGARASLLAAGGLTLALLAILHAFDCTPTESATALPFLWSLCALQFASDSFATDLSSGRLATRSTLPVGRFASWSSKLGGFAASLILLCGVGISLESAWLGATSGALALREFVSALPAPSTALMLLALVGSTGMLCSLVVEGALTAMLLASVTLGALWAADVLRQECLSQFGRSVWLDSPRSLAMACAAIFLIIGCAAFVRAERRLGDSRIRIRVVLIGMCAMLVGLAGTVAAASWSWRANTLEDPNTQIFLGTSSRDGRFLAFESAPILPRRTSERFKASVWVLDLDTKDLRLLATPGRLLHDAVYHLAPSWDPESGLTVIEEPFWDVPGKEPAFRVREREGGLVEERLPDAWIPEPPSWPEWAEVSREHRPNSDEYTIHVRWKGTPHERAFRGTALEVFPGRGLVISPRPGRVFVRRGTGQFLADLDSLEERLLVDECWGTVDISPDQQAFLVKSAEWTHVLSSLDGEALIDPLPRARWGGRWIQGDNVSHELLVVPVGRHAPCRVLDLEEGREVSISTSSFMLVRVGERGYVHTDDQGNLVWSDRAGALLDVLIARGGPRR